MKPSGISIKLFVFSLVSCGFITISGCSSQGDVNFDRYTLTQDVSPKAYDATYQIALDMAPILLQGGIVIQVSDVALRPAKNYRYSANLDSELKILSINEMLKNEISDKYALNIYISKFQGTIDGKVLVDANIRFYDKATGKKILSKPYHIDSELNEDGYDALVSQLKQSYITIMDEAISDFKSVLNDKSVKKSSSKKQKSK